MKELSKTLDMITILQRYRAIKKKILLLKSDKLKAVKPDYLLGHGSHYETVQLVIVDFKFVLIVVND